jgi:hypothetical protein
MPSETFISAGLLKESHFVSDVRQNVNATNSYTSPRNAPVMTSQRGTTVVTPMYPTSLQARITKNHTSIKSSVY